MENSTVLELRHITKRFPGVLALSDVSISLKRGSVHALVGENGAGKSTLMKILSGMYKQDEGEVWIGGDLANINNERDGFSYGVSMIYQELNSVLDMTVYENIFLGRMLKKGIFIDKKEMKKRTQNVLQELGINISPEAYLRDLSVAQRQMVEIAKAILRNSKIFVMDEPTSSISLKETEVLFDFIRRMQKQGISILYISHRLEEIFEICDDITIIRDGNLVHSCRVNEISKDEIIQHMVGRKLSNQYPKEKADFGDVALSVRGFSGTQFNDVSFDVRAGEILGISGLIGAGRTEVVRAIFGLDKCISGKLEINGKNTLIKEPGDAIDAGIALVSEDRRRYGLVLCESVKHNISLVHIKQFLNKLHFIKKDAEKAAVDEKVRQLNIKASGINAAVNTMSGGNQQKVVLAKWMIQTPKVLILDEPTRGIDVGAKFEIYRLMVDFAKRGIAIIMISSELPEILGMSDRVLVMAEGEIKGEFETQDATQEKIIAISAGGAK